MNENLHYSVLLKESIESLNLRKKITVVDCTVNRGGHAEEIAKTIGKDGTLVIFDLDKQALLDAEKRLHKLKNCPRIICFHSNYRYIKSKLNSKEIYDVDAIFADLGLSSQELEVSGRGFTFQKDEPLYMTLNSEIDENTLTAMDLIENLSTSQLDQIFKYYGGEKYSWRIANAITEEREKLAEQGKKIDTTAKLVKIIESVVRREGKTNPSTKVFQALRIAVNDEYEGLRELLKDGYELLKTGGVISVISFHSGEDRIVKEFFKTKETKENKQIKIKPSRREILENKRSRSALLRIITKI